jgi:hypothetical protein
MKMVHLSICVCFFYIICICRHWEQTSIYFSCHFSVCVWFFNKICRPWEQTSKLVLLVKYEDNATDVFDEITIYVVSITALVLVRTHVVLFHI